MPNLSATKNVKLILFFHAFSRLHLMINSCCWTMSS